MARRQELRPNALVAVEAYAWPLAGRTMEPHIRGALQPVLPLLIRIGIMREMRL